MLIDTNVLVYTLQPQYPSRVPVERAIRLLKRERELFIVPQNLYELWVVATRPIPSNGLGMSASVAALEVARIKVLLPLLPDTPAVFTTWEEYDVTGKPAHDARLLAAMRVHGLTSILTFDRAGFSRYQGLDAVHPEDV